MKNQGWRSHDTSLCLCCERKKLRAQQHVMDAAHRTHKLCSSSLTSIPSPALHSSLTSHSAPCPSSSIQLISQAAASSCFKFPPSCQNPNILGKSCNFSLLIASGICINALMSWSNKIYQELLTPNSTPSPTFSLQPPSPELPKTLTLRMNYKSG